MSDESAAESSGDQFTGDPTDIRFVGPATAAVLADASVDPAAIPAQTVSYEELCEAGVNPGVAARIRREHSLPWSFDHTSDEELQRRATQVRNLRSGERAWVAASARESGEDPERATDGSGDDEAEERAWRDRSWPAERNPDG